MLLIKNGQIKTMAGAEYQNGSVLIGDGGKAPVTRMGTAALLRDLLRKSHNYFAAKEADEDPAYDAKLEAMLPV